MLLNQVIDECSSTNDLAKKAAEEGAPHGSWISSRAQTAGRGRLGREWISNQGNLFLSIVARVPDMKLWTWLPLATAIGMSQFLSRRFPKALFRVKWPNDVWAFDPTQNHFCKLGGILCESVVSSTNPFVIVGIGLNCETSPETFEFLSTSLQRVTGLEVSADEVREQLVASVVSAWAQNPNQIRENYEALTLYPAGTSIEWGSYQGKVIGLGPAAELMVSIPNSSQPVALYAEDIRSGRS